MHALHDTMELTHPVSPEHVFPLRSAAISTIVLVTLEARATGVHLRLAALAPTLSWSAAAEKLTLARASILIWGGYHYSVLFIILEGMIACSLVELIASATLLSIVFVAFVNRSRFKKIV